MQIQQAIGQVTQTNVQSLKQIVNFTRVIVPILQEIVQIPHATVLILQEVNQILQATVQNLLDFVQVSLRIKYLDPTFEKFKSTFSGINTTRQSRRYVKIQVTG